MHIFGSEKTKRMCPQTHKEDEKIGRTIRYWPAEAPHSCKEMEALERSAEQRASTSSSTLDVVVGAARIRAALAIREALATPEVSALATSPRRCAGAERQRNILAATCDTRSTISVSYRYFAMFSTAELRGTKGTSMEGLYDIWHVIGHDHLQILT